MNNTIKIALSEYGVKEIKGVKDNPEILKYFQLPEFKANHYKDETAWCSAFANWVMEQSNLPRSKKLTARSWLKVGTKTNNPSIGDIAVFWRQSPNSWKGHVAFFIKETKRHVYVLGGNQGNRVCIQAYPKNRLLEFRKVN